MSTRRAPDSNPLERIGARVRQRALTGSEASMVGFTLVVYIFAGAGLGYLLDKNLETNYWIAIGTLAGAAIGFREMFRLTRKLTRRSALEDDEQTPTSPAYAFPRHEEKPTGASQAASTAVQTPPIEEPTRTRPRVFSVPAPPQASFESKSSMPASTPATPNEPMESEDELIERLLQSEEPIRSEESETAESAESETAEEDAGRTEKP